MLAFLLLSTGLASTCEDKIFPIFAGGSSNEFVNCFEYDPATELIIVGGNTTSPDFGPTTEPHGFIYALDLTGNWMWGNYILNGANEITDVSACHMSSDRSTVSVFAIGDSKPVVMEIDTRTGNVITFISLESSKVTTTKPYFRADSIYIDKEDFVDGQEYIYAAFLMDDQTQILRLKNPQLAEPAIDWIVEFQNFFDNLADPHFFHFYPIESEILYVSGRY